jgi:DNA modification methylase
MASKLLSFQYVPVESLQLNPQNPRLHSDKQLGRLATSIRTFGCIVPILINGQLHVIAGHGRVLACRSIGMKEVPAIQVEHLSEQQKQAFMLADNRLAEKSEWDERLLGEQLKILAEVELNFPIEATGFEMAEIDLRIENLDPAIQGENDPADALPESSPIHVSRPGDTWELGGHRVGCGNALAFAAYQRLMSDRKANVVFTDPPYNVRIAGNFSGNGKIRHREFAMGAGEMSKPQFTRFLTGALSYLADYSTKGSLHYICMDWRHIAEVLEAGGAAYSELKNLCVWTKDNAGMGSFYRSQHELVFVFQNGKGSHRNNVQLGRFGRSRSNVWHYPGANSFSRNSSEGDLLALHPTVKPVALVADAILDCSARGDLVLDPFLGSGTTVIAAERTGRICYGLELDPIYVDTVVRRWQRFTGLEGKHESTGQSFAQREKEVADDQE